MYANGLFGTGLRRFYVPFVPRVLLNDLPRKRERTESTVTITLLLTHPPRRPSTRKNRRPFNPTLGVYAAAAKSVFLFHARTRENSDGKPPGRFG